MVVVHKWLILGMTCLALMLVQPLRAQKEGAVWYFGQNAGLDFNQYYPKPLTKGKINTREGVATICDKEGKLLFYTDGQTVYDRNHNVMSNGDNLYGDISSTQSSIIVPRPGAATQYYIFTVDQAGTRSNPGNGLKYSIVDMSMQFGVGSVIQKNQSLPNVSGILFTEKITVVKHADGKAYWIIAHEFGTANFYEFLLNETSLVFKDIIEAGSVHVIDPSDFTNRGATGYLKSSPKGDFLATAVEGLHVFELLSFDNRSGDIRLVAKLPAGTSQDLFTPTGAAYGIEFSPTSNFLYGSTRKGGTVYQWNLSRLDQSAIQNSVKILRSNSSILCGALQLAFNGKIYVSLGSQPYLGVINSPIQENCNYIEQGASLIDNATVEGGRGHFGLPTFLSDFFKAAEFYFENTCFRDKTVFYVSTRNAVDPNSPPVWSIQQKDGTPVGKAVTDPNTWIGVYTFPAPGDYVVVMSIKQFGSNIDFRREVTIHPLPELDLPDTTSLCKGSPARLDAGDGAFYSWRDNPNLNVERYRDIYNPGEYVVTVTHYNGCSNSDSTFIVEKPLPVIRDTLIVFAACGASTGSIRVEMEQPNDQYEYFWPKIPGNTTNQATDLPVGVYDVKITSKTTGCSLNSRFSLSEDNAPAVSINTSVTGIICPGTKVTLRAEGAMQYLWENPEGKEQSVLDVYPIQTTTYRVKGFSVVAGTQDTCSAFGEKTIQVYPFNPPQLGKDRDGCRGDTIVLNGGNNFESWTWSNNETGQIVRITESVPELVLFAKDRNQCILTDTITVKIKELPVINLGNDTIQCSGKPLELYGGEGDSYAWSAADSPARKDTTARIYVNFSDTYKLTITKNGCSNTDSIAVTVKELPKINLNYPRDTTICLADSIRLTGGKGDAYLWSNGKTTQSIYVDRADQYWLRISLDGCDNSDTVDLKVNPVPKVDLGRDTAFCKSNPVRLTGGSGDSYLWEPGGMVTPDILVNETGTYSLTITKNGCPNSDTVKIRINDPGLLKIKSVDHTPVSCPGYRDGSLRINAEGSGISYEYSIDGGENFYTDSVFKGLYGDHEFHIMVREDKACIVTWDEAIVFKEPEPIQIGYHLVSPSCELCPDGEINLQVKGGTPPYSVKWSTNDTVSFLSNVTLGKYLVWVTDVNRCPANAMIDLTLDYPPFQIPNAFTPNGDGINEKWEIASLKDFPDCLVKVFDRSGKLIWWSEAGYPEPWDGIDKSGNVLPVGSYYYLVWLRSDLKPLKGSVSILR